MDKKIIKTSPKKTTNKKKFQHLAELLFVFFFLPPEFILKLFGIIRNNNDYVDYKFFTESINLFITIIALIIVLFFWKKVTLILNKSLFLFILILFCIASYFWVNPNMTSSSQKQILILISAIIKNLAIVSIISTFRISYFKTLLNSIIYILFFNLIFIVLFFSKAFNDILTDRFQGLFSHPNNLGLFCGIANILLFLLIKNFLKNKHSKKIFFVIIILLFNNILLILSNSITSIIGSIFSILALIIIKPNFFLKLALLINIIFFVFIITNDFNNSRKESTTEIAIKQYFNRDLTFTGRTNIWDLTLKNLYKKDKLFLGYGIGGFWGKDSKTPSQQIDDNVVQNISSAHNGFLGITIDYGIIMLIFVMILLFIYIEKLKRNNFSTTSLFFYSFCVFFLTNNLTESSLFQFKNGYFNIFLINIFIINILKIKK